jgi:cytochrome oxidase assembly protein ShyY1
LQLAEQQPDLAGDALTPVPLPPLDDGPHLSYAIQWFIFSTIALVGYPLILRRHARGREDDDDADFGGPHLNGQSASSPTTGVRADTAIQ